jgi:hypothetical protein
MAGDRPFCAVIPPLNEQKALPGVFVHRQGIEPQPVQPRRLEAWATQPFPDEASFASIY